MAIKAVENLINTNKIDVTDVDMIITSTFTPDHMTPTVSALVQGHFGIKSAGTFDLSAACTGYAYALWVADSLITSSRCKKVLIISTETMSKVMDYADRNTCILFGDAAVATLVEQATPKGAFLGSYFTSDGKLAENVICSNLSNKVNSKDINKPHIFQQEGRFLYEYVVKNIPQGISRLLESSNIQLNEIDWFVPHSANLRMIEAICKRLAFPIEKTLISNEYYANTSSASIPLAISIALEKNKIKAGNKILLYGFGGGLTHGGLILNW
jgi:3-oxoacyl-[acyl-carrier-protein] synthase-3